MKLVSSVVVLMEDSTKVTEFCASVGIECITVESVVTFNEVMKNTCLGITDRLESKDLLFPERTVLVLGEEKMSDFFDNGFRRFIFDRNDFRQYALAFVIDSVTSRIAVNGKYVKGSYDFDFDNDVYKYKGEEIYLTRKAKFIFCQYLVYRNKVENLVQYVHIVREKLGDKDFMSEDFVKLPKEIFNAKDN